jgi:adenine specific DNA methylase Mod
MQDSARKPIRPSSEQPAAAQRRPARAELIWDGKYDEHGRRVAPLRVALPFQTVETVNESAQDRQKGFAFGAGFREEAWRNRLIWGDKKYVLPSLLPEFAGKVNLIYIDPPFDTGADFSFTATVPDARTGDDAFTFTKEPSIIEHKAYRDIWGGAQTHLDAYLKWIYETVVLLHELLAENGSLYLHVGSNVSHYVKLIADDVFGSENFLNEIIWKRTPFSGSSKARANKFPTNHDCILFYSKLEGRQKFEHVYSDYSEEYKRRFKYKDDRGWYRKTLLKTYSEETEKRLKSENRWIEPIKSGAYPSYKQYLHESKGKQAEDIWPDASLEIVGDADDDNVWEDLNLPNPMAAERTGYPTQKPEILLETIVKASSERGDLVFDCFCGSGTTAAVAEKLERRWITCDLGRFAIHTSRKRFLSIPNIRPFVVQNLGKYERQAWAGSEFGDIRRQNVSAPTSNLSCNSLKPHR